MTVAQDVEPIDSPTGWVAEHARKYIETNGEDGHLWRGVPTLALTTTGRRSGKLHRTMLIYGVDGDRYIVVASRGGADEHPQWYLNLVQNPDVQVQILGERFTALARTANAEEKPALWELMAKIWPSYTAYQAKTTRAIPVVILERNQPQ